MSSRLTIHKHGPSVIHVRHITRKLLEEVNRCAAAERKMPRDFCIDALEQAIKDSPLRLGIQRIDQRLKEGVPSRPSSPEEIQADREQRDLCIAAVQGTREGGAA